MTIQARQFLPALLIGALLVTGCRSAKEAFDIGEAGERNPGPCPRAFAIYDASRIVEFTGDGAERFENIGFTGEIAKVRSLCRYFGDEPIIGDVEITMDLGRGPAAASDTAVYEIFVAVTRKNIEVINKQVFPVQVTFPAGQDRVRVVERIDEYVLPRANGDTSGENFEIITGFVVTDQQREFNAQGKRFRVNAGQG